MKLLIYALNYKPEEVGIGKYTGEMVDYFLENGFEVKIITSVPYYPNWRSDKNKYYKETKNNLEIFRCPLWIPKKPNGLKRIIHLISFSITSFPIYLYHLSWNPNGIITIAPSIFNAQIVIFLKRFYKRKVKTFLHIQDLEIDAAFDMNLIKNNLLKRITKEWEKNLINSFDIVSTISPDMLKKLEFKKIKKDKLFYMPNWINLDEIYPVESNIKNKFREKYCSSIEKIIILYSGTMNKKQGLDLLAEIILYYEKFENIFWLLVGEGPEKEKLIKKLQYLRNLKILPLQKKEDLNLLLNSADIHILPQRIGIEKNALPSKFLGMLASGKPIITCASKNTFLGKIASKVGIRVDPENKNQIIEAILTLASNNKLRKKYGFNARRNSLIFEKITILRSFLNKILETIN